MKNVFTSLLLIITLYVTAQQTPDFITADLNRNMDGVWINFEQNNVLTMTLDGRFKRVFTDTAGVTDTIIGKYEIKGKNFFVTKPDDQYSLHFVLSQDGRTLVVTRPRKDLTEYEATAWLFFKLR
jgi:hypothetical protein|tara:strand:- start:1490 stop:1864 length:375 start_codon:yes stop_codon:yes gene_type:complete